MEMEITYDGNVQLIQQHRHREGLLMQSSLGLIELPLISLVPQSRVQKR